MFGLIAVFLASLLIGWIISFPVVWTLKVLHVSQYIREEGPSAHKGKAGTPTMGGIAILTTIISFSLILINVDVNYKYLALIALVLGFALLGFLDDYIKVRKRKNTGLLASEKFFGQVLFATAFSFVLIYLGHAGEVTGIAKDIFFLSNPYVYLPFMAFVVVSSSNAVNLTDGLDGLAAGLLAIAFFVLGIIAFGYQIEELATISMIASGATLSFLWFNFNPAEIFMGDVGSLGLGALLAGIAILLHKELLLVLIAGMFVIETLSVMLQVSVFKMFKVRLFKMSPLHHHFELKGMNEKVIVIIFYIFGIVFALGAFFLNGFL